MTDRPSQTIVIVGGVAGGASAAARARRLDEHARIVLFEKDAHVSFANCGLPYYIGREIEERDDLLVAKPDLLRERFNLDVRTRCEVLSIDREKKTVRVRALDEDRAFEQSYDNLILAPGAEPIVPPIDNARAPGVFTLRNLDDTDAIDAHLSSAKPERAVVVGAGFIGLEMVEQLRRRGVAVALAELAPQVLPPLDADMARFVEAELARHGVELHLSDGIAGVRTNPDGSAAGVTLSSGAEIDARLVILGVGVRPMTRLAADAGIRLGATGAIATDRFCRTSDPDVYAVGDAAEYEHRVTGRPTRAPLGGPANRAGRVAGEHAASGVSAGLAPVTTTAIVRVFGLAAGATGLSVRAARRAGFDARAAVIAAKHHAGYYPGAERLVLKLVYDGATGRVLGAQAVGPEGVDKRLDVVSTAIHFGATIDDLAGLDLAYAPPFGSAKDPVHMAAFAAQNDRAGLVPLVQPDEPMAAGEQVVDVRTPAERDAFRLVGSTHIEIESLRSRAGELDRSRPVATVCHSGLRAHAAARILRGLGFPRVRNITGGMMLAEHTRAESIERPEPAPTN